MPKSSKRDKIDVAVIAVPAQFAQSVLEQIAKAGIKAVMNFAPTPLQVEQRRQIENRRFDDFARKSFVFSGAAEQHKRQKRETG
ncbi:MAG: hypothetical protein WKF71_11675 [Pyrinomonadaceae bacterium]